MSEDLKKIIVTTFVTAIVSGIASWITGNPRIWIIFLFLLISAGLLFIHFLEIARNVDTPGGLKGKEKSYWIRSEKIRKNAGIMFIIVMLLMIILLFLPGTGQSVRDYYWATITPTPTPTPTVVPSPTATYTASPTPAFTQTPSNTPTKIPSVTPSVTPLPPPAYDFKSGGGCISEKWRLWPPVSLSQAAKRCNDFSVWGMDATRDGLNILVKSVNTDRSFGICTQLPGDNATITVKTTIKEISVNKPNVETDLFLGMLDPSKKDLTGNLLSFRAYSPQTVPIIIFGNLPGEKRETILNQFDTGKEFSIDARKNKLSFAIQIVAMGNIIEKTDIPINKSWESYCIGYKVPQGGTLSAIITQFNINEGN